MTAAESKITTYSSGVSLVKLLRSGLFRVVIASGCFDLLHSGHIRYLESARNLGDHLIVGVNADWAVKALKGPDRPINILQDRMYVLAGLQAVSYVIPVDAVRVDKFIRDTAADVWAKGGDYTLDTLDKREVQAAKESKCEIVIIPVERFISTTEILRRA